MGTAYNIIMSVQLRYTCILSENDDWKHISLQYLAKHAMSEWVEFNVPPNATQVILKAEHIMRKLMSETEKKQIDKIIIYMSQICIMW